MNVKRKDEHLNFIILRIKFSNLRLYHQVIQQCHDRSKSSKFNNATSSFERHIHVAEHEYGEKEVEHNSFCFE